MKSIDSTELTGYLTGKKSNKVSTRINGIRFSKPIDNTKLFVNILALSEAVSMLEDNIKIESSEIKQSLKELMFDHSIVIHQRELVKAAIEEYRPGKNRFSSCLKKQLDRLVTVD